MWFIALFCYLIGTLNDFSIHSYILLFAINIVTYTFQLKLIREKHSVVISCLRFEFYTTLSSVIRDFFTSTSTPTDLSPRPTATSTNTVCDVIIQGVWAAVLCATAASVSHRVSTMYLVAWLTPGSSSFPSKGCFSVVSRPDNIYG
jgi:hypothetical protein